MLSYNYNSVRTNSVERKWAKDFFLRVVGKGLSQCFFPSSHQFQHSLLPPYVYLPLYTALVGAAAQALFFCLSAPLSPQ